MNRQGPEVRAMYDRVGKTCHAYRQGVALLVVLFIIMAITILSLGFLSRSDVELACGENMILRTQMDYLADSGLEHARGLLLNPQEVEGEYWTGAIRQQLYEGDDYYDVSIQRHEPNSGSTYRCNYTITSTAYRQKDGERIGQASIKAELRLDPCIALWTGSDTSVSDRVTINGDVYCNGVFSNGGVINGDVFARSLNGSIVGQRKSCAELLLQWPQVTVEDFTSHYSVQIISIGSLGNTTLGGSAQVFYRYGSLVLTGDVQVEGMLIVEGDLIIRGDGNIIIAEKNIPGLLVTDDVIIENGGKLAVQGLAVVKGKMQISVSATEVDILGALFIQDILAETIADSSGNGNNGKVYGNPQWQPSGGKIDGALEFDGVDDYVQTFDSSSKLQLTADYTLAVWIKANPVQKKWAGIFSKCNPNGSINHWTLQFDNSRQRKLIIYHPTTRWDTGIRLSDIAGRWHHIRIVRRGETMTSYLDGTEIKSGTWSSNPGNGNGHLNIGADRTTSSRYVYKGLIDDIRIYNCAPDPNETYPQVAPIGHWKLDEEGGGYINITAAPSKTAILIWPQGDVPENWGQAAGAFFRSIERK